MGSGHELDTGVIGNRIEGNPQAAALAAIDTVVRLVVMPGGTFFGARLLAQLRGGADFAELARLRSGDGSAAKGGDMGYLHRGMLGDQAQQVVDALAVGEVGEPVTLLEGVAIFRLEDRPALQLLAFEEVRERVRGLWLREHSEQAWQALLTRLRADTVITVSEGHYLPLPAGDSGAGQATGTAQ